MSYHNQRSHSQIKIFTNINVHQQRWQNNRCPLCLSSSSETVASTWEDGCKASTGLGAKGSLTASGLYRLLRLGYLAMPASRQLGGTLGVFKWLLNTIELCPTVARVLPTTMPVWKNIQEYLAALDWIMHHRMLKFSCKVVPTAKEGYECFSPIW